MKQRYCIECGSPLSQQVVHGEYRIACSEKCGFVLWDNPVPVVAAIVLYREHVLLARNASWPGGIFALITGFLEKGESPGEAVMREVKEELNLDSDAVDLVGLYPFEKMNQLIIAYEVRCSGEIKLSGELAEYKLISPEKLRSWEMGTGPAVKDWIKKKLKRRKF